MNRLADWLEAQQMTCAIKSSTGVECPGCGSQRALAELLRGDLVESFLLYPPLMPFLLAIALLIAWPVANKVKAYKWSLVSLLLTSIILGIGNWVLKLV